MPFDTPLSHEDEVKFQTWKAQHAPNDSGEDYDFRGAYKAGLQPGPDQHWLDTYKKPNHPTFSDESIYSSLVGTRPGSWHGPQHDQFVPFRAQPGGKQESMSNPIDTLQTGLRALDMSKMSDQGFDINAHHERALSTGPFAVASQRQSIWDRVNSGDPYDHEQGPGYPDEGDGHAPAPIQVAQAPIGLGSNPNGKVNALGKSTQQQLQALDEDAAAPLRQSTSGAVMGREGVQYDKNANPILSADALEKDRVRRNTEMDAIEKRLRGTGARPNETEDQRLRRMHPELY